MLPCPWPPLTCLVPTSALFNIGRSANARATPPTTLNSVAAVESGCPQRGAVFALASWQGSVLEAAPGSQLSRPPLCCARLEKRHLHRTTAGVSSWAAVLLALRHTQLGSCPRLGGLRASWRVVPVSSGCTPGRSGVGWLCPSLEQGSRSAFCLTVWLAGPHTAPLHLGQPHVAL